MTYPITVAGLQRELPICRVTDDFYIAGFVIFGDAELTVACARELNARVPEYDYAITAEAKGIPLIHEMARQAKYSKYFVARKAPKLYMSKVFSHTVKSITTEKELVLEAGGIIAGSVCIPAEGDAAKRNNLIDLSALPTFNPDDTVKK